MKFKMIMNIFYFKYTILKVKIDGFFKYKVTDTHFK